MADVETWIASSLAGDRTAWMRLLGALWDQIERIVGSSRAMGQLRGSVDDRREVVSRIFARLRRNELRALRTYSAWRARHPDKTFDDWIAILSTNVIRDYVSERLGRDGVKRLVNTWARALEDDDGEPRRPPITNRLAAGELLALAAVKLTSDQHAALAAWLAGDDADRATVRAALARLRREARA